MDRLKRDKIIHIRACQADLDTLKRIQKELGLNKTEAVTEALKHLCMTLDKVKNE